MKENDSNKEMPFFLSLSVVFGIFLGVFLTNHFSGNRLSVINTGGPSKLNDILHFVEDQYVDTVDLNDLIEKSLPEILAELDPHSVYISAKDVNTANDDLKGSFSGVGIEFVIRDDTIRIQNVIPGGPSEQAGLQAGDKIVSVDDKLFVGKEVTNEEAMRKLKGPKGSKVKIGVLRYKQKEPKYFTVTRDDITMKSVSVSYMLDNQTGYIKVKNFGERTYFEFLASLAYLSDQGFKNLIVDLCDNTGGYMASAIQMANEFLPDHQRIVYTEGRKQPREDYMSDGHGSYQDIPLVVLINEASASASEIFAGAIQDNDRGTIIGRRSFGKGLVQQQIPLSDGSMIRLTIARYYTPSGRCIQKPYTAGSKGYEEDLMERYLNGEFFSQDSIKHTGPAYHTRIGREVYGGGGITPDIFVPEDTTNITSYYKEAAMSGLILQYAFDYTDNHRNEMKPYGDMKSLLSYLKKKNLVEDFATYADRNGLQRRNLLIQKSHKLLENYIFSRIIYNMLDEEAWVEYLNMDNPSIIKAKEVFKNDTAFPKLDKEESKSKKKVARSSMPAPRYDSHFKTYFSVV